MKEGLDYFTDTYLTSIGLMIFFLFFIGVFWWTAKKENRKLYERVQNLPLESGDKYE
jgi:cytochrome c oxidase cbb3-type subunit 4